MAQSQSDIYTSSSHFSNGQVMQTTELAPRYKDPPNTPTPRLVQSITPDADQLEQLLVGLIGKVQPFDPSPSLRSTTKNTAGEHDC
ncbi:hypothetical protein N7491_006753 [Penicillium cf. griseofulvum]|uniref:Uncharacterized protein n=1 Tax=Penicillium cf. griseofulvum TaxID=2972120 RepID=A0A9W9M1C6_9EURO|nr:hypothetical protein N7472_010218 [Penicillium cf. griseofulvum]KAJ5429737.1 hypothetical protein N7491_006753 [Penicillium cf. griseofulvum]KAJ5436494.1 hypothetical protein N7445_007379 [Penicillium cf. griseofulvum]